MDCIPPGSSVHRIVQARILKWIAIPFSRGSSRPRDQTQVSCTASGFFTIQATKADMEVFESPLDCKEIKPVNPKGNQPWISIRRTDAEAPIHWPPDAKSRLIGKDPDAGRLKTRGEGDNRGWDGWMALLTQGHEFEQTQGDSEGQRNLAHRSPQRHRELDMTWRLKNNNEEKDRPGGQWTSKEKVE